MVWGIALIFLSPVCQSTIGKLENNLQEALDRVAKGRTVITIAHRLSTVQSAAEVAVIQDGGIAESGSHEELLHRGEPPPRAPSK